MSPESWINVITAVGTFAAVGVAIWLGRSASVKAEEEAQLRAKLAAAGVSARLSTTADRLAAAVAGTYFLDETITKIEARIKSLEEVRRAMRQPFFRPEDKTLLALTPLPNKCAHRIARAFDYLERVRLQAQSLSPRFLTETATPAQLEHLLSSWSADLGRANDLLSVAVRECVVASDLGAPMPSGEELYGPREDD